MSQPRSNVVITGGARMTALTAEIEAGEMAIIKYLASCYRRASEEFNKWKVCWLYNFIHFTCVSGIGTGIQSIKGLSL